MSHSNNSTGPITIQARLERLQRSDSDIILQLQALSDMMLKVECQMDYVEAKLKGLRLDGGDVSDRVRDVQGTTATIREDVGKVAKAPVVQNTYHFHEVATVNNTTNDIRALAEME